MMEKEPKPRHNLYKLIHKYARQEINRVSELAGSTDFSITVEKEYFKEQFRKLILFLDDHASREDTYIHPLLEQADSTILPVVNKEHEVLDSMLKELDEKVAGIYTSEDSYQFYLDLVQFQAAYYNHLENEERIILLELHKNYTDEELDKTNAKLMQSMTKKDVIEITKGMLPALNHQERVKIFTLMKQSMPQGPLMNMCHLACSVLSNNEFQSVMQAADITYQPKQNVGNKNKSRSVSEDDTDEHQAKRRRLSPPQQEPLEASDTFDANRGMSNR